jgi:hypothetical protein
MKKLVVLATLAFALATVHQASACDWGAHAANATPVVVGCATSNCVGQATEEQTTQQPTATPDPAAPTVVSEEPPAAPVTVACNSSGC